jgi:simple sugar transport system permease protein
MIIRTMLISGALAGLVGMSDLLGFFYKFSLDYPANLGFTGIAVALLGRNHPAGIAGGALLFGFLDRSALILDLDGIPKEIAIIMQGVIVLSVVVAYEIVRRIRERREQQMVAAQVPPTDMPPVEVLAAQADHR